MVDFDSLNALAEKFQLHMNAMAIHTRTKKARFAKWLEITLDQLRTTAPEKTLLALATEASATPKVSGELTVQFKSRTWSVRHVPGVFVGMRLEVNWYPLGADMAMAMVADEGREIRIPLEEVLKNEDGFPVNAATIGLEFKAPPETISVTHAKEVARRAAGTQTLSDTDKVRKDKQYTPFDGAVNSFIEVEPAATRFGSTGKPPASPSAIRARAPQARLQTVLLLPSANASSTTV